MVSRRPEATLRLFGDFRFRGFAGDNDEIDAAEAQRAAQEAIDHGITLFQREQFLKQLRVVQRLRPVAARHGKSVAQLALSLVLGNPAVTVALVGIRRSEELKETVAAVEWRLSPDERQEIDTIFAEEGVPTRSETSQITRGPSFR